LVNGLVEFPADVDKDLYKTTPKWHGFLMIKLAAFQASGGAHLKPDT